MTQIETIIAEIERLMNWKPKAIPSGMRQRDVLNIRKSVLLTLKDFIKSLPAEQQSEDLEYLATSLEETIGTSPHSRETIISYLQQAAQWQKKQMMKNCLCNTEVMLRTKQNDTEYLTLANDKLPHIPVSFGLNVGDKVKVIIVKDEQLNHKANIEPPSFEESQGEFNSYNVALNG